MNDPLSKSDNSSESQHRQLRGSIEYVRLKIVYPTIGVTLEFESLASFLFLK
jgi:hypothetical protein